MPYTGRDKSDNQSDDNLTPEQATLVEVARGLNATVRLVQALHHEVKEFAIGQATLRLTIGSMEETMKELRKAITATDPASLTIRLVVLEREFETFKEWKKEHEARVRLTDQERERAGWQLRVAAVSAGLSFIGSVIVMVFSFIMKH